MVGDPVQKASELPQLVVAEAVAKSLLDPCAMGGPQLSKALAPSWRQLRFDVSPIDFSSCPRNQTRSLKAVDSAREATGAHDDGLREITHPKPAALSLSELGENI